MGSLRSCGLVVTGLLAVACGGGGGHDRPADASVDASADAEVDAALDAGTDAPVGPTCDAPVEGTLAVDPEGGDTQIYSSIAWGDDGAWIAYCRPEESGTGLFDVLVTKLGCDGATLVAPVVVSGTGNDIAPSLARSGDRLLVAWMRDRGEGMDNLDIVYRVVDRDGVPLGDAETVLETTREGVPVPGNALDATVAARPDGFVLAGARSDDELSTFQVFAQEMDPDGALVGEATDAVLEPGVTQEQPAVAVGSDGRAWLAWVRDDGEARQVMFRALGEGASAEQAFADVVGSEAPAFAIDPADPARAWLAATVDRRVRVDVMLTDVGRPAGDRPAIAVADAGETEHTPALVATAGGGAVLLHRVISGIQNEVSLVPFHLDADAPVADPEVSLARARPAGPYPLGLAAVADAVWLATWSDGTSPAFRLRGRFVSAPQ